MPSTPPALFHHLIDYAGLFPPARLPMTEAFARFATHRATPDGWLLARFVCPARRLAELAELIAALPPEAKPVRIAALGSGGDDPPAYAAGMEADVDAVTEFAARVGGAAVVDVFEVRLPGQGDLAEAVDFSCDLLAGAVDPAPMSFFECSLLGDWPSLVSPAVTAVAAASHEIDRARRAGLKIRCGGLDAAAIPTVEAVAAAVIACRDAGLPIKATQGLHHPIRRPDPTLGATTHGFVNLVAAAILAREHRLGDGDVQAVLADEDAASFAVSATGLRWRGFEVDARQIADGRVEAVTSFGSCSFAEPRDDLVALGWL